MFALLFALACSVDLDPGVTVEIDGEVAWTCTEAETSASADKESMHICCAVEPPLQAVEVWEYDSESGADLVLGETLSIDCKPRWSYRDGLLEGTCEGQTEDGMDVWVGWSVVL